MTAPNPATDAVPTPAEGFSGDPRKTPPDTSEVRNTDTEPVADSLELPQNLDQARNLRSENKNLRQRMKAAEEGLQQASARLLAMQRAEVERLAASELIDPADLWTAHADVDGFLTDDGTIDPQRVTEAAQAITTVKPHLAAEKKIGPPPTNRPVEGLRPGASPATQVSQPTWADAIRR